MYADVNGVKLFFDVEGKEYVPDGPVLRRKPVCLVLHGGPGGDHTDFLPELSVLADTVQLVYIDHRGCGRSAKAPVETYDLEQNADDAEALRQYLGLDRVFVLGHSYGGMVAQQYALKYQEHVQGLIVSSSAPSYRYQETLPLELEKRATEEMKKENEFLMSTKTLTPEDMKRYMKVMNPLYYCNYKKEFDDGIDRTIWAPDVWMHCTHGKLSRFDFVPELPKLRVPTLVIVGEEDFVTPTVHSREIASAIPGAELVIIPGASHETYADKPEEYFGALRSFILRNASD